MSDIKPNSKMIVCCLCVNLTLWALSAHAAELPADPNNAALLYYQAMLNLPELDYGTDKALDAVLRGDEPDEKIRNYLGTCRETIELVVAAVGIQKCDWGIRWWEGFRAIHPTKHIDTVYRLLCVDAMILAADGNFADALKRCLATRQFAAHIGDDTMVLYALSHQADRRAQGSIRRILGSMPPDAKVLTWLQDQITAVRGAPQSPAKALKIEFEQALQTLRTSPTLLARIRDRLVEKAPDESAKQQMKNMTDEELVARRLEACAPFLDAVLRVIGSEAPHEEKYKQLEGLTRKFKDELGSDPTNGILSFWADQALRLYRLEVSDTARLNALRGAIAIYIEKARSGQLPPKLPSGLPKDPYSDQDFEYERTEEGFVLRSQVKPFDEDRIRQYDFKVQE